MEAQLKLLRWPPCARAFVLQEQLHLCSAACAAVMPLSCRTLSRKETSYVFTCRCSLVSS